MDAGYRARAARRDIAKCRRTMCTSNSRRVFHIRSPTMNSEITIVLVHGFWGGAAHWSKVIVQLSAFYETDIFLSVTNCNDSVRHATGGRRVRASREDTLEHVRFTTRWFEHRNVFPEISCAVRE